ncbi:DUF2975 domain-containing protein [Flavobacteriaceae bacterium R38]|nr:DUF2975 domain-containing protein [Flavobacteriaceae bacterium R38]
MKDKSLVLQILLGIIILTTVGDLIGDLRDYNLETIKSLKAWNYEKYEERQSLFNLRSKPWLEFSYHSLTLTTLAFKIYLLLGFYYLICVFHSFEKEKFFSPAIISYFKKAGNVFLTYCISVFILNAIYYSTFYDKNITKHFYKFDEGYTLLFACGIAFYAFAEIFKKAQTLQEENDLTI